AGDVFIYLPDAFGSGLELPPKPIAKTALPSEPTLEGFGDAMAADDKTLLVGAPNTRDRMGAAYLFTIDESEATVTATLRYSLFLPEDPAPPADAHFGCHVAIDKVYIFIATCS